MKTTPTTPESAVSDLFAGSGPTSDLFAQSFLKQVPVAAIEQIVEGMKQSLGTFQKVEKVDGAFETIFEKGKVPTQISLDAEGRFVGLFFRSPVMFGVTFDDAVAALQKLPGRVSVFVSTDGVPCASVDPDLRLAVGSAYKLVVLVALTDQIAAKKRAWDEVVTLREEWKSLPSGFLQTWPVGTPITLATLASLMISQSDNTATDALADIVGRTALEEISPQNKPFLKTREVFVLKAKENDTLLQLYQAGDIEARRGLLLEVAKSRLPKIASISTTPRGLDVEWFLSCRELATLMEKVADLPLMSINPGVAEAPKWERVAYKGGSEPGVLNLTMLVQRKGKRHTVVFTWNDDSLSVDQNQVFGLYSQLLSTLQDA